jgi:hypothetical protein
VTLTCPVSVTYSGSAQEPCAATATGAGGLNQSLTVSYSKNTNAGTASAMAKNPGVENHNGGIQSKSFEIAKASSTATVTCPANVTYNGSAQTPCTASVIFTGSPLTPCSANVTGVGGLSQPLTVSYSNNTSVGTASASATYPGDGNHLLSSDTKNFTVTPWTFGGFYQPVDMGGVYNTVKNGSTVPLKFEVFAGATELTATSAVKSFVQTKIACDGTAPQDDVELTTTGGTSLRYDTTAGQFVQNWQTPKTAGACYRVTMTTQDGSALSALFKLK